MLGTKELYDLMAVFERSQTAKARRLDKENKDLWKIAIYQDGETDKLFRAFMEGYTLAKSMALQGVFE